MKSVESLGFGDIQTLRNSPILAFTVSNTEGKRGQEFWPMIKEPWDAIGIQVFFQKSFEIL